MSLLTTASPWTNSDDTNTNNVTRKRMSTMRKTMKNLTSNGDSSDYTENFQDLSPSSISQTMTDADKRNSKINQMVEKMTSIDPSNDGSKLANFNPPPQPELNNKKPDAYARSSNGEMKPTDLLPNSPVANLDAVYSKGGNYGTMPPSALATYSNYNTSYQPSKIDHRPYYAKMGITTCGAAALDDKLLEKINYMIHLLEEQQHEKTSNITEEFILYTFLGIFIIFVVDSFARAGKYVR